MPRTSTTQIQLCTTQGCTPKGWLVLCLFADKLSRKWNATVHESAVIKPYQRPWLGNRNAMVFGPRNPDNKHHTLRLYKKYLFPILWGPTWSHSGPKLGPRPGNSGPDPEQILVFFRFVYFECFDIQCSIYVLGGRGRAKDNSRLHKRIMINSFSPDSSYIVVSFSTL